jgi:hypothetical protein
MNGVAPEELHILTERPTAPSLKGEVKYIFVCQEIAENNQSSRQGGAKDELKFSKFWLSSACCHLADCSDVVSLQLDGKKVAFIFNNKNGRDFS